MMRDYAGLCAVFVVLYGAAGIFAIPSLRVGMIYLAVLAAQLVLVRQAAANYGKPVCHEPSWLGKTGKEVSCRQAGEDHKATRAQAEAGYRE